MGLLTVLCPLCCHSYNCCQRDCIIALFTVPWVHDEKTPAIVNAWVRMNFNLEKPWEPHIHHHADELPPMLPGADEAQLLLGYVSLTEGTRTCACAIMYMYDCGAVWKHDHACGHV